MIRVDALGLPYYKMYRKQFLDYFYLQLHIFFSFVWYLTIYLLINPCTKLAVRFLTL